MLSHKTYSSLLALTSILTVLPRTGALEYPGVHAPVKRSSAPSSYDFVDLYEGNKFFQTNDPELLSDLALHGQEPPFLYVGCSDSRVNEDTIFDTLPGTFFGERNIANQFYDDDVNIRANLAYGIEHLHVNHVLVMGHYGCGGVAAAVASPPAKPWDDATAAIQKWIAPIRTVYEQSSRPEVVAMREQNNASASVEAPTLHDKGFRALIEENVKSTVNKIASDTIVTSLFANKTGTAPIFFIHGFVYDIETGAVYNLNVSVGPPGLTIPSIPFPSAPSSIPGQTHRRRARHERRSF